MKQWLKKHFKQHMIRPTFYKAFSYFLFALTLALFWNRFVNTAGRLHMSHAYTIMGLLFFALAWLNYLRLDGIKLPFMKRQPLRPKKRPHVFSDISDYLGEEVVSFDELVEEERDTCCLVASIICGIIFFFLSII